MPLKNSGSESNGSGDVNIIKDLLRNRVVFLTGLVDGVLADSVIAQLLYLAGRDPKKEIKIIINSPGGLVDEGLAIYDVMQALEAPISTICVGHAASLGAVLLAAGTKGKRYVMPNARVMIHQVSGGFSGQATDMKIQMAQIEAIKKLMNGILSKHTGKTPEQVGEDAERDYWMTPKEAVEYGVADKIIKKGDLFKI